MFESDAVFHRVIVDFAVQGGTRVSWLLDPYFCEPGPYQYRLEVGSTGLPAAPDWADCGVTGTNIASLVDPGRRLLGGTNLTTHYRVVLTTGSGTHRSQPADVFGLLPKRDWLLANQLIRLERLRNRFLAGVDGWLLKRKRAGTIPNQNTASSAVDFLTGEPTNPERTDTVGTEFTGGYYDPFPFTISVESATGLYEARDPGGQRGTVDDPGTLIEARLVPLPPVAHRDVFVADGSDLRHVIHEITYSGQLRGVPIVAEVKLRLLPFDDVVYSVAVPESAHPVVPRCP